MPSEKFKRFLSSESRMSLREAKRICENAGYKVHFNESESEYTVQPRTKEELKEIIEETIREQGPRCDLNFIDTSLITDMSELFENSRFNGDISKWDVSNVKDMSYMFADAKSFNQPIGNWDVSNVKNMMSMFEDAKSFNQPIGKWAVYRVECMTTMFCGAESFNQPLDKWNVSRVKDMRFMFQGARSFNQSLNNWDVARLQYIDHTFDKSPLEDDTPGWYWYDKEEDEEEKDDSWYL